MKKLAQYLTLILIIVSGALCLITREEYEEAKKVVQFEVLEYEKVVEIFKDREFGNSEVIRKNYLQDKMFLRAKSKEQAENDNFLALESLASLPKEFDWRKVRPDCFQPPIDQSNCGSCYIFATVSVLEERFCIHSSGKIKNILSQQDVLSCDDKHYKCHGGTLFYTWEYLENVGTCSYQCKPYVSYDGFVPNCKNSCDNTSYNFFRWRAVKNSMKVIQGDNERIKQEIYLNGPVSSHMETFEDLGIFKGGIYIHGWGKQTDPHAINIVGWGYSDTYKSEYWIVRNSWGKDWGSAGYFGVLFDYYRIGEQAVASLPQF
jgi:C1A family cysteine protease